jgi:Uma2 family endonuclease
MTSGVPILTPPTDPGPKRWTVSEFMQLAEAGLLSSRAELVHGEIWEMAPQGNLHAIVVWQLARYFARTFDPPWFVRVEAAHRFSNRSAYEPDFCLLERMPTPGATLDDLPRLVVEVSDTTLANDLSHKRLAYAQFGVPEYWVVDIARKKLHVFREPDVDAMGPDEAYGNVRAYAMNDTIAPLAAPERAIVVRDLFPS